MIQRLAGFLLLTVCFSGIQAQGIEFFTGTFDDALEQAKLEDKAIFVDAYTTWCGPCKRMSKYVFTEAVVGDFYNANFINMKLDMEKEEGMKFRMKYPVSAYPTFYYIQPDGKVLYTTKGGRQPAQFVELGETALAKYDRSGELQKKYEEGDRSPETVLKYIKALNRKGDGGLKVANDYLSGQSDLTTKENLLIINEATLEADSRVFDLFIEYRKEIIAITSKERYVERGIQACEKTVDKAIEFKVEDLLNEAISKHAMVNDDENTEFELASQMRYYAAMNDAGQYAKSAKKYVKKVVNKDSRELNKVVEGMLENFNSDPSVMKMAEKYAANAAENGGLAAYYLNYAYTLFYQEKYGEARKMADEALQRGEEEKINLSPIRTLLTKLDQL